MPRKALASGTTVVSHPIALSVMRMCGVDPVSALNDVATWPEGYAPDYVENDCGTLRMRCTLDGSRQVQLTVNGGEACISARGQSFPDSVIPALAGLPLSRIVDHVLFTGTEHLVRVAEAFDPDEDGVGTRFHLEDATAQVVVP